ncbi:MAG: type II toxin-antitoxin system RelE/ParE family toxin [Terracidiphilus sp.]
MLYRAYCRCELESVFPSEIQGRVRRVASLGSGRTSRNTHTPSGIWPELGRPEVDTLKGSAWSNMKELRFKAEGGVWRVAFAFDPKRAAILLVPGDKAGVSEKRFYKRLIDKADQGIKIIWRTSNTVEEATCAE